MVRRWLTSQLLATYHRRGTSNRNNERSTCDSIAMLVASFCPFSAMMFMTSLRLMTPLHSLSNKRYAHLEEEEEEKKNKSYTPSTKMKTKPAEPDVEAYTAP